MTKHLKGNGAARQMRRLALAAASAAVAGLAACSHAAAPSATSAPTALSSAPAGPPTVRSSAPAGPPTVRSAAPAGSPTVTHTVGLVSCKQQYDAWKQGSGNGLVSTLSAVGSADKSGNAQLLTTALKRAEPAVARAARYPMPACADPKGYWEVLLMHVNAATASTGSASSLKAAMDGVPTITRDLLTELKRVDG